MDVLFSGLTASCNGVLLPCDRGVVQGARYLERAKNKKPRSRPKYKKFNKGIAGRQGYQERMKTEEESHLDST